MELKSESEIEKRGLFDEDVHTLYGDSLSVSEITDPNNFEDKDFIIDEDEEISDISEEYYVDVTGKDFFGKSTY